jgi:tRNA threonylcarbamoyladenosine modification (KEOPS) complex Cgi121 subunit
MQFHVDDKYLEITGFRAVKFADAETFLKANRQGPKQNSDTQFFDADLIATHQHLYFSALYALQAFKNKTNIAKTLAMEIMLYASAQRQIQRAIQRLGIKPQTTNMAAIIVSKDPTEIAGLLKSIEACVGSAAEDNVLEMSQAKEEKICIAFQITDAELDSVITGTKREAVVDLVIERAALLATQL